MQEFACGVTNKQVRFFVGLYCMKEEKLE